jgi:hypothetical protein
MGKLLMVAGLVLVAVGALIHYGVPLGRLPGDVLVRRGAFTFAFPIVTCLLVSLVLTLLVWFVRR